MILQKSSTNDKNPASKTIKKVGVLIVLLLQEAETQESNMVLLKPVTETSLATFTLFSLRAFIKPLAIIPEMVINTMGSLCKNNGFFCAYNS